MEDDNNKKITLKYRKGDTYIELEGSKEHILDVFDELTSKLETKTEKNRKPSTVTEQLNLLIYDGFFDSQKKLIDIYTELEKRGYYFKSTTISPILTQLVRKGMLFRLGKKKSYAYVKRP